MSDFLERNGLQTVAQHFKDLFLASVHRDGAEELLERLENETDFFEAPAGAKHHGAFPGGLVIHSLNVYRRLREITIRDLTPRDALGPAPISEQEEETVAILGLLHDVCKAGVYHIERKCRRNPETGVWEATWVIRSGIPSPWDTEKRACTRSPGLSGWRITKPWQSAGTWEPMTRRPVQTCGTCPRPWTQRHGCGVCMRLICAPPILTKGARTNDKAVMFALRHRSGGQG